MNVLGFLLQNKVVVALSVLLFAFFISTISLAVQKNNTKADLRTCQSDYSQCNDKCTDQKGSTTTTTPAPWEDIYRLPSYVIPISYNLVLRPDIVTGKFTGTNRIHINVTQSTTQILLHSHTLTIASVLVEDSAGNKISDKFELIEEQERLEITLTTNVPRTGSYDDDLFIAIEFSGSLEDRIVGLYKSTYSSAQGESIVESLPPTK